MSFPKMLRSSIFRRREIVESEEHVAASQTIRHVNAYNENAAPPLVMNGFLCESRTSGCKYDSGEHGVQLPRRARGRTTLVVTRRVWNSSQMMVTVFCWIAA